MSPKRAAFLPRRAGETDSERRLREALNRHCTAALNALDAALALRTAPQEAQKARHQARNGLGEFCSKAMLALAYAEELNLPSEETGETNG
jgi:hypothetical protein